MQITRKFTQAGKSPFDEFEYTMRASVLRNPDGKPIFNMEDIEVPKALVAGGDRYPRAKIFPQAQESHR